MPEQLSRKGPMYVALAEALARDIGSGRIQPGDRLPTHRELARRLGVNVMTVTRGYAEAGRRGLVEGEVGRGTFVRRQGTATATFLPLTDCRRDLVDFHFNIPVGKPSLLDLGADFEEFAREPNRVPLFTGYNACGLREHREAGAKWISGVLPHANPERLLVTGGVQHAMMLSFSNLCSPGDVLLTEELTYPGVKALSSVLNLRTQPIAMDDQGLLPDAFETACKKSEAKVLYTMPTVHNPTGVVLPEDRREEIVRIARHYGVTIVEDDTYAFLCADPPTPLASLLPEATYYLIGTSKSVAAGLRIGYLLAPTDDPTVVEHLALNVAATSWMAAPLMAQLTSRILADGRADRMIAWKRKEARARRELFGRTLGKLSPTASHPGVSHVWFPLPSPWRCEDFTRQALKRGVAVTPSESFVVGRSTAPHAVRICLGTPDSREETMRGLSILQDVLRKVPGMGQQVVV